VKYKTQDISITFENKPKSCSSSATCKCFFD